MKESDIEKEKIKIIEDAPELQAFQIGLCALKNRLEHSTVRAFWNAADPSIFKGVFYGRQ